MASPIRQQLSEPEDALLYMNFEAARCRPDVLKVLPFYPDVVWHPARGRLNTRLPAEYLDWQVVPAIKKKQQLTRRLFEAGAQLYLGTDVGQPFLIPGASLLEEMMLFVERRDRRRTGLETRDARRGRPARHASTRTHRESCAGRHPVVSARSDEGYQQRCDPGSRSRGGKALSDH